MKKTLSFVLVLVLTLGISVTAYAGNIISIYKETGFSELDWGSGATDTVELGEINPGASFTAVIPEAGAFQSYADEIGYTRREARDLSIAVRGKKNPDVLSSTSIVYGAVSGVHVAHLNVSFVRTFPVRGSKDLEFEFELLPVINGRTYSQKGVTFTGTLKNDGSYRTGSSSRSSPVTSSGNVGSGGSVSSTSILSEAYEALKDPESSAILRTKSAESISVSTLKSLASAASKAGKDIVLYADTLGANGELIGRLYVEPAKLTKLKTELKLGVSATSTRANSRKSQFQKIYSNNIAVISCAQQGSFGASLKIAAKAKLPKNASNLIFYSYDLSTNKLTKMNISYRVDKNGFVHFATELAGDIIISDGPLKRKS